MLPQPGLRDARPVGASVSTAYCLPKQGAVSRGSGGGLYVPPLASRPEATRAGRQVSAQTVCQPPQQVTETRKGTFARGG